MASVPCPAPNPPDSCTASALQAKVAHRPPRRHLQRAQPLAAPYRRRRRRTCCPNALLWPPSSRPSRFPSRIASRPSGPESKAAETSAFFPPQCSATYPSPRSSQSTLQLRSQKKKGGEPSHLWRVQPITAESFVASYSGAVP